MSAVDRDRLPSRPGIFVMYRDQHASWAHKSADLRATFGQLFAAQGPSAVSPIRRGIAGFLGISTPVAIASGRYRPTSEDHARVTRWIRECTVAWVECASEAETLKLEARLFAAPDSERVAPALATGDPKPDQPPEARGVSRP